MYIYHQINHQKNHHKENEAGTDQETVTQQSMPFSGMDKRRDRIHLSDKNPCRENGKSRSSSVGTLRTAGAVTAAAGVLAAVSGGFLVTAGAGISLRVPPVHGNSSSQTTALHEKTKRPSADGWEEEEVLRRWDLDPENFPPEEEEALPEIPEDLLPYFTEAASLAVEGYAGEAPPEADLRRFSPRADAVRKAVRAAAGSKLQEISGSVLQCMKENIAFAGEKECPALLYALQDYSSWLRVNGDFSKMFSLRQPSKDHHAGAQGPGETVPGSSNEAAGSDPGSEESRHSETSSEKTSSSIQMFLKDVYPVRDQDAEPLEPAENPAQYDGKNDGKGKGSSEGSTFLLLSDIPEKENPLDSLIPPELYAFSIQFPADRFAEISMQGAPLFPGLSNYIGLQQVPDYTVSSPGFSSEPVIGFSSGKDHKSVYEPVSAASSVSETRTDQEQITGPRAVASVQERDSASEMILPLADHSAGKNDGQNIEKQHRIVLIGDSRTVGMEIYCGGAPDEYWIAKNSMGYSWMADSAVPGAEPLIEEGTDVVILMGVNDLGNVSRYVDLMNRKAAEWKKLGARTFFVSVTPVDDRRSPNAKNSRIEAFNAYAQSNLEGVIYIDAYNRIRNSFGSPDGIHFSAATYRDIYRIIKFSVYSGWYEEAGLWFYFDRGKPLTGWQYLDGQWQYLDGYGVRWVRNSRIGEAYLAPYPETGILDPYEGAWRPEE